MGAFLQVIIVVASVLAGMIVSAKGHSDEVDFVKEAHAQKKECELSLPRTQQCVMLFVPEEKGE